MTEKELMNAIRAVLSRPGTPVRLWRNNVGQLADSRGIPVKYGLAVGSADLVGIIKPSGRWLAVEVKTPKGRATPEQLIWLQTVRDFGGIAVILRSVEEAEALLREISQ